MDNDFRYLDVYFNSLWKLVIQNDFDISQRYFEWFFLTAYKKERIDRFCPWYVVEVQLLSFGLNWLAVLSVDSFLEIRIFSYFSFPEWNRGYLFWHKIRFSELLFINIKNAINLLLMLLFTMTKSDFFPKLSDIGFLLSWFA